MNVQGSEEVVSNTMGGVLMQQGPCGFSTWDDAEAEGGDAVDGGNHRVLAGQPQYGSGRRRSRPGQEGTGEKEQDGAGESGGAGYGGGMEAAELRRKCAEGMRIGVRRATRPAYTEPQSTECLMAAGNYRVPEDAGMEEEIVSGREVATAGDEGRSDEVGKVDLEMKAQAARAAGRRRVSLRSTQA